MKYNIFSFLVISLVYISPVYGGTNKTIQLNAVENSQNLTNCDLKSVKAEIQGEIEYISITLTQAGKIKANNFFSANKGKKLILVFQDDVLINNVAISHPSEVGSLLIQAANKKTSVRIVKALQKLIKLCGANSV